MKKILFIVALLCVLINCRGKADNLAEIPVVTPATDTSSYVDTGIIVAESDSVPLEADEVSEPVLPKFKGDSIKEKHIVVDKDSYALYLVEDGETLLAFPVCLGKGIGQKKRAGDHKTPEGEFKIKSIENSSDWTHDFRDGKGKRKGAYGPWFFRLNTPQSTHIGIHGTCYPESVRTRESDGCVRLRNEDLLQLKEHVAKGMKVIIYPDSLR